MIDLIRCGPFGDCKPSAIPAMMSRDRNAVSLITRRCCESIPTGRRLASTKSSSRATGRLIAFSQRLARALRVPFTSNRLRHGLHVTSPAGALLDLGVGDIALAGQHPGVVGGQDRIVELVELPAVGRFFGRLVGGVARVVEALGFAVIHGDPIPGAGRLDAAGCSAFVRKSGSMLHRLFPTAVAAVLLGVLAAPASAAVAPFNFDTTPGRLPKTVVPPAYRITLTPDATAKTLAGTEEITLDVRRATGSIVFNTHDITISEARLDGTPVAKIATENEKQLTTLTLAHPAAVGRHVLTLTYSGKIEDSPDGLFAQDYRKPDGTTGRMLSTQFESTDARRMFPSWDEPAFRAPFELTAIVPASWSVVTNTRLAPPKANAAPPSVTLARAPRMPTYLVEFSGVRAKVTVCS